MFGKSKSKKQPIQTPIGDGVSSPDSKHGEVVEVRRYHRGAVIDFSWYPSLPSAQNVPEVAAAIQIYIDRVHDMIDADEDLRNDVIQNGGIYPMSVFWGRDDCDFFMSFAYAAWDDGILRFFFRDGEIVDTDVCD
ncbi:MAG: hypothetical protein ABIS50_23330 [Luteolibacter sp.]|uniref:hypothetical protein n=1 Tax=Luteolibacter sp. TaxID=1962973 RepID=UPI0032648348